MADLITQTQPLLNDYMTKANAASSAASDAMTLPDMLTSTLKEKLANSPIVTERSNAATAALTELGKAPTRVMPDATGGVVLNPVQQENLISGYRASAINPLVTANQRYDLMTGTIGDIVGQATRAYQAKAQSALSSADMAKTLYSETLDRLVKNEQLNKTSGSSNLNQMLAIYRLMKPNATQEKDAINAQSGLEAITKIKEIMNKNPGALAASKNGITRFFSPDAQQLYAATTEAKDVLTRLRTGAALNKDEVALYENNIPNIGDAPETLKYKLGVLEGIYNKVAQRGQQIDLLDFLGGGMGGSGESDWSIVGQQ